MPAVSGALRWRVDPARSELALSGSVMGVRWADGLLRGLAGSLLLDLLDPAGSSFDLCGEPTGLYVGDPFLNTRLRLGDILADDGIWLSGALAGGPLAGEYEASVRHNLAGIPSPLPMAVELWRWDALASVGSSDDSPAAPRVSFTARQLDGFERLELHVEAVPDQELTSPSSL
jgi:hypothetical protein